MKQRSKKKASSSKGGGKSTQVKQGRRGRFVFGDPGAVRGTVVKGGVKGKGKTAKKNPSDGKTGGQGQQNENNTPSGQTEWGET